MTQRKKTPIKGLDNVADVVIRKATTPGLNADGGNLYLRVGSASQKSWVFLFQRSASRGKWTSARSKTSV